MDPNYRPGQAEESLETLKDIKRMMERSSRFISLSGLSGISAGVCALAGAYMAVGWFSAYSRGGMDAHALKTRLLFLAMGILAAALLTSSFFTWRKARKLGLPIWDRTARKVLINMAIPLVAGGFFVLGLYSRSDWELIAPSCLVFYGLALVNTSKYTLNDIRTLGILEILLGCINLYIASWNLLCWALGFGVLHIIYGLIMWWKYEK